MHTALEVGLHALVVLSALAMAGVERWAALPLWIASAGLALGVGWARVQAGKPGRLLEKARWQGLRGGTPGPSLPLLVPGALFLAWIAAQLLPLPSAGAQLEATSLSPTSTLRGALFVGSCLAVHVVAGFVFRAAAAFQRFLWIVSYLGLILTAIAVFQQTDPHGRVYGVIDPRSGSIPFGVFWNRNQCAAYMLIVLFCCTACVDRGWRKARGGLSGGVGWRLWIQGLRGPLLPVLFAIVPLMAALASLLMTKSRGAILSLLSALALIGLRRRAPSRTLALALLAAVLAVTTLDARIRGRFLRLTDEAPVRAEIWSRTLAATDGQWLFGSGLNTFARAVPRWIGYPAAHNEYLQVLVEAGVPGLALVLWGTAAALRSSAYDPWLTCALLAPLLHASVDLVFQVPATGVLFAALSGGVASSARK